MRGFLVLSALVAIACMADAAQYVCQDSDGGNNIYVRGTTIGKHSSGQSDTCITPSTLSEKICDTRAKYDIKTIFQYCKQGCWMGACRNETKKYITVQPTFSTSWKSNTSEDSAGKTAAEPAPKPGLLSDTYSRPQTVTTTYVKEEVSVEPHVENWGGLTCVDTDGGDNTDVKGIVTINGRRVYGDACINPSQLQEGTCMKSRRRHYFATIISCENGCRNGACR